MNEYGEVGCSVAGSRLDGLLAFVCFLDVSERGGWVPCCFDGLFDRRLAYGGFFDVPVREFGCLGGFDVFPVGLCSHEV